MTKVSQIISITQLSDIAEFELMGAVWNGLLEESDFQSIFLTHEWMSCWWESFKTGKELYLLLAREEEKIIGIAPLMVAISGRRRKIQFIGAPNADYSDIIGSDKHKLWELYLGYLRENRRDWNDIELTQIPERSSSVSVLNEEIPHLGLPASFSCTERCSMLIYEGPEETRRQYSIKRSRKIKRALGYFGEREKLVFKRIEGKEEIGIAVKSMFMLHINRWQETPTKSKFLKLEHRQFHENLASKLNLSNKLMFFGLFYERIPVCYCLGFSYNGIVNLYTIAYNLLFSKNSPGLLHLTFETESLIRMGFNIDYSRGSDEYKELFANREFNNFTLLIQKSRIKIALRDFYVSAKKEGILKSLAGNDRILKIKNRAVSSLTSLGPGRIISNFANTISRKIIHVNTILIYQIKGRLVSAPDRHADMVVNELCLSDLELIATLQGLRFDSPQYARLRQEFENGSTCYGASFGDLLVGILWIRKKPDLDLLTDISIGKDGNAVFLSDIFMAPIFRDKEIQLYLLNKALNDILYVGKTIFASVIKTDLPSIEVLENAGFEKVKVVRKIMILGQEML